MYTSNVPSIHESIVNYDSLHKAGKAKLRQEERLKALLRPQGSQKVQEEGLWLPINRLHHTQC